MATASGSGIGHKLMIKYGLPQQPDAEAIESWRLRANAFVALGFDSEEAGNRAASQVFAGFNTVFYASEADDIESLLDAAGDR